MKTKKPAKFPFQNELLDLLRKETTLHSVYVIPVYKEKQRQNVYLSPQDITAQKVITDTLLIITHKAKGVY